MPKTKRPALCKKCRTEIATIEEFDRRCPAAKRRPDHHQLTLAQWCRLKGQQLEWRERAAEGTA